MAQFAFRNSPAHGDCAFRLARKNCFTNDKELDCGYTVGEAPSKARNRLEGKLIVGKRPQTFAHLGGRGGIFL